MLFLQSRGSPWYQWKDALWTASFGQVQQHEQVHCKLGVPSLQHSGKRKFDFHWQSKSTFSQNSAKYQSLPEVIVKMAGIAYNLRSVSLRGWEECTLYQVVHIYIYLTMTTFVLKHQAQKIITFIVSRSWCCCTRIYVNTKFEDSNTRMTYKTYLNLQANER